MEFQVTNQGKLLKKQTVPWIENGQQKSVAKNYQIIVISFIECQNVEYDEGLKTNIIESLKSFRFNRVMYVLKQGPQTQIDRRATFSKKNAPRAKV